MEGSQPQCIGWIQTLFGECMTTQQQAWSFLFGYISIFCWLNAQIPQIIENFKLGSAASLSLPFLINWLLGDISNLIGCILTHQLPFQMYLAIYFCIADVILFGQWIYYSHREQRKRSLPDIDIADLPEITETEYTPSQHHHHRSQSHLHHSRRNTTIGTATDNLLETGVVHDNDLEQAETVSPLLQRPRPRRLTTTSDIAHRRSTSIVLFGLVLLTMRQTLPALQEQGASGKLFNLDRDSSSAIAGRVFARALEGEQGFAEEPSSPPADQNIVQLGRIFAWVCTVFYLSSRMPQLWKNFKRKSVQGLSILMFFWAAMGNLSYTLSILNSADAVNPETRRKFLREAVPYVLGSSGTLMFDLSIFGQWLFYTGKLSVLGLGPKSHRHGRHRHRHHHSRQRGSRSQSRVDSMVLSPSASQSGGMYNILVDEDEDPDLMVGQLSSPPSQPPTPQEHVSSHHPHHHTTEVAGERPRSHQEPETEEHVHPLGHIQ